NQTGNGSGGEKDGADAQYHSGDGHAVGPGLVHRLAGRILLVLLILHVSLLGIVWLISRLLIGLTRLLEVGGLICIVHNHSPCCQRRNRDEWGSCKKKEIQLSVKLILSYLKP